MTSLDIVDADRDEDMIPNSSMIPCLLCHQDLDADPDEHKKHLKLEHKVKFKLSWIINKTWKESVKTWKELINSYSSSNVKEETLNEDDSIEKTEDDSIERTEDYSIERTEDDSIERTKIEPGISEENEQDLDEQYFAASELLAKKKSEKNFEKRKYKPYKCSFCEKSFKTKSYVEEHVKKHPGETVIVHNDEQKSIEENEQNFDRKQYKPYTCSFCEKSFKTKSYVEEHVKKHPGETVIVHNDEQKSIEENEQTFDRKQYKPYKCSFCEKSFKTKSYVEEHVKKHPGETVIVHTDEQKSIEENEQTFYRKQYKPYKCSFCEKSFKTKSYVEEHVKKHPGETVIMYDDEQRKRKQCSFCDKSFKTKSYVEIHEKKHSGESVNKTYQCSICTKAFNTKNYVKTHEKKHAGAQSEPQTHPDDEQNKLVENDRNISNSNMCSFEGCEKKCLTRDDLGVHLKTHKKQKHKCSICGKGFKTKFYVLIHEKKNHNYQCSVCEEAFTSKKFIRVHGKKKHSHGEIKSFIEPDENKHIDEFDQIANMLEGDQNKLTDEFEENTNTLKTWGWPS